MKEKKYSFKFIISRLVVIIMIFLMLWQIVFGFTSKIVVEKLGIKTDVTDMILGIKDTGLPEGVYKPAKTYVNWQLLYPDVNIFKNLSNQLNKNNENNEIIKKVNSISSAIKEINTKIKDLVKNLSDNIIFSDYINQAGALYNATLNWEIPDYNNSMNIVSLGDGYFSYTIKESDPSSFIDNVVDFKNFLDEYDIPLIYGAAPRKVLESDVGVSGVVDYSAQLTKKLVSMLREKNIDTIDFSSYFDAEFEDPHEAFFKTDLHWKPETGLMAAGITSQHLNDNYNFDIDMSDFEKNKFRYDVYEKRILGAEGRKLTVAVAEPEDFTLIYPKEDFHFRVSVPDIKKEETGTFDVFYDYSQVLGNIEYYDRMAYESYMYGGNALWEIENLNCKNDKKVLILCDSFGRTFSPFFALGVKRLDVIDLRQFTGSLRTYIDSNKDFDAVIILYNTGSFGDKELKNFS